MGVSKTAVAGADTLTRQAALKEQRRRETPAAIAALIEGGLCSVNAFRRPNGPVGASQSAGNVLMRLNFHPWTVKGWAGKQKGDT
jgi:hypothetical protein